MRAGVAKACRERVIGVPPADKGQGSKPFVLLPRVDSAGAMEKPCPLVKAADRLVGSKIPAARHGTRMATAQQTGQLFPASPGACVGSLASRTRAIARDFQALMVEVLEGEPVA